MKYLYSISALFLFTILTWGCDAGSNKKEIAVLKFVTHPALDEMENAFVQFMDSTIQANPNFKGYRISTYNANGKPEVAKSISESISNKESVSLIVTIATPAAIAASTTPSTKPLLYGAVADPQGAKIIPSSRATGIQNAGPTIISEAISFIKTAFPNKFRIGTLYNATEQNSIYVQGFIKSECERQGLELTQLTVDNTSQIPSMTEFLCEKVDVIYSANDNTVNSGIDALMSIANAKKIPVVIGDLSTISKGPLFAIGLEYKAMGKDLAKLAFRIISGEKIKDIPPQGPPTPLIWWNENTAIKIGFVIPDSAKKLLNRTID